LNFRSKFNFKTNLMKNVSFRKENGVSAHLGPKRSKTHITIKTIQSFSMLLCMCLFVEGLQAQQPVTVSSKISSGAADAEENIWTGGVSLTSPDLDLLFDGTDQHEARAGLHFTGLNIPAGATVQNAYIQFSVDEIDSQAVSILIYGEAADNPAIWTTASQNISSRAKTTASVTWSPPDWLQLQDRLPAQQTSDLSSVIQEIVNRTGYTSTDAINIIMEMITPDERRVAESYEGSTSQAPELFVTYVESSGGGGSTVWNVSGNDINYTNGKVGIGTTLATNTLTIAGADANTPSLLIRNESYDMGDSSGTASMRFGFADHLGPIVEASKVASNISVLKFYGEYGFNTQQLLMTMRPTSVGPRIGIGTDNPDATLTVNGQIHADEVLIDLNVPAPDYVFKKDYELNSLRQVQDFIKEHGHLPNMPSAKEMETNGVELGRMEMRLLEKIEELTLYILDQEKRQDILEKEIDLLKKRN